MLTVVFFFAEFPLNKATPGMGAPDKVPFPPESPLFGTRSLGWGFQRSTGTDAASPLHRVPSLYLTSREAGRSSLREVIAQDQETTYNTHITILYAIQSLSCKQGCSPHWRCSIHLSHCTWRLLRPIARSQTLCLKSLKGILGAQDACLKSLKI